jgi:hypothetical protein
VGSFIALLIAAVGSVASPIPDSDISEFRRLMFATPLPVFIVAATATTPPSLDWSTDLCSAPLVGNTGRSFDFANACRRHDFAYRNLKRFDRRDPGSWWNSQWRAKVDRQFRIDLRNHCDGRPLNQRITCRWWAEAFYRAVRTFGGP